VGVVQSLMIVYLSGAVAMLTTLSMSAICSNGKIKTGGAYYVLSRVLGLRKGGAIGILYAFSHCFGIALYTAGFAETLQTTVGTEISHDDVRLYGFLLTVVCLIVVRFGFLWKTTFSILIIIAAALMFVFVGTFITRDEERGITGYREETANSNVWSNRSVSDFFRVFSVYFPAATGIMGGANRSGELKNPSINIAYGTIASVLCSTTVYAVMSILVGCVAVSEVDGNSKQGLRNNFLIMADMTPYKPVVIVGIFVATMSSALSSFVGGHRMLVALGRDNILPWSNFLLVNENRTYLVVFFIGAAAVCIGSIENIAKLFTMIYLLLYSILNCTVYLLESSKSPGWRPSFKHYTWWTGLSGSILCAAIMLIIDWVFAVVAFALLIFLYRLLRTGSYSRIRGIAQIATRELDTLRNLLYFRKVPNEATNFRPHYLLLWKGICSGCAELDFLGCLAEVGGSAIIVGSIITTFVGRKSNFLRKVMGRMNGTEIIDEDNSDDSELSSKESGVRSRRASTGERRESIQQQVPMRVSHLNLVNNGKGRDSQSGAHPEIKQQHGISRSVSDPDMRNLTKIVKNRATYSVRASPERKEVAIEMASSKAPSPFLKNYSGYIETKGGIVNVNGFEDRVESTTFYEGAWAHVQTSGIGRFRPNVVLMRFPKDWKSLKHNKKVEYLRLIQKSLAIGKGLMISSNFPDGWSTSQTRRLDDLQERYIDVWWLTDVGGLLLLIPYLLSKHREWKHCRVRLFTVTDHKQTLTEEQRALTQLLSILRIPWEENLEIIPIDKSAKPDLSQFATYLKTNDTKTKDDLERWAKIAGLLRERSSNTEIVFVTMPLPRRVNTEKSNRPDVFSTKLEVLASSANAPIVFIRGNGENVLTFSMER